MCVEQYCRSIALRICKSQCHTQHFYVAMMDEFALDLLGTAGHLFSNSTNSSSQSYNRNFLRTLNSENMFLKSVLELAVSLALRLCYCKSVTGVPLLIRIESVPKMSSAALRPHRYRHSSTLPTFPLRVSLDLCHPRTILNVKSRKANLQLSLSVFPTTATAAAKQTKNVTFFIPAAAAQSIRWQ